MATLFNTKIKDTYQSLLKLEDNTILTTTSKNITDGLGNASPLYLSTTQVRIGSNSGSAMYWDNTNNRLGIGTSSPTQSIETPNAIVFASANNDSKTTLKAFDAATGNIDFTNEFIISRQGTNLVKMFFNNTIGIGGIGSAAKLGVRGSGSTSATTSLLVQNSSAQQLMSVIDDGSCTIGINGSTTTPLTIVGNTGVQAQIGNNIFASPQSIFRYNGGQLNFFGANNDGTAFGYSFNNSQQSITTTIAMIGIGGTYNTQQAFQLANLRISPTYDFNVNTTTNAIARGIYYNPTITNLRVAQHRAIETTTGDVLFGTTSGNVGIGTSTPTVSALNVEIPITGNSISDRINLYLSSSLTTAGLKLSASNGGSWIQSTQGANGNTTYRLALNPFGEGVYVGTTANLNASLGVRGAGSTNATTSLLVQNSSGTTIIKTTDDQVFIVEGFGGRNTAISAGNSSGQGYITADISSTLNITGGFQGIYLKFNNGTNSSTVARVSHNDFSPPTDNSVDLGGLARWKTVSSVLMSSDQYQLQGTNVLSFNSVPHTGFYVETGATKRITIRTNGSDAIRISETQQIGIGTTSLTARLQVQGSGSTSATTSLLVQNSLSVSSLTITDDRTSTFGGVVNITPPAITGGTQFFTVKSGNWPTALIRGFENGTLILGSSTGTFGIDSVSISSKQLTNITFDNGGGFAPNNLINQYGWIFSASYTNAGAGATSEASMIRMAGNTATSIGNVTLNQFAVKNTINNTAGTTINRGYFYDPTLTSVVNTTNIAFQSTSGSVNINTSTIQASAILQADSTTQGFLPPRVTTIQKNAISLPAEGLMVYDTDLKRPCFFNGTSWITL